MKTNNEYLLPAHIDETRSCGTAKPSRALRDPRAVTRHRKTRRPLAPRSRRIFAKTHRCCYLVDRANSRTARTSSRYPWSEAVKSSSPASGLYGRTPLRPAGVRRVPHPTGAASGLYGRTPLRRHVLVGPAHIQRPASGLYGRTPLRQANRPRRGKVVHLLPPAITAGHH